MEASKVDRYISLVNWARDRYTGPDGALSLSLGGRLSRYCRIERAAAAKYLGCAA